MFKILQITDTHLLPEGGTIFDSDPAARLVAAIADINRDHNDAALCVLTGDLTHAGDPAAYAVLRRLLDDLLVPYQLLPGNHDERAALLAAFPQTATDTDGFLQSHRDVEGCRLVFLDTVDPGVHSGRYCSSRRRWLEGVLTESSGRPVYMFMHHPPMSIVLPRLDQYIMAEGDALGDLLAGFPNVRHLFIGHVHRPVSGSWRGISFSSLRGTNQQNWLDFSVGRENISSLEPPAYAIAFIDKDSTVIHLHDYLDSSPHFIYDPDAPVDRQIRRQ